MLKKTEFLAYKQPDDITIKTKSGELLKKVQNFKYLGGWVASSEQDFEIRKALAWSACNKMLRQSYCTTKRPGPLTKTCRKESMAFTPEC